jgi:UDP-N-acetylglucosamine/UDP-N-acetylgalactosamine diphosphorylase
VEAWGPERVYVAADVCLEHIEPGAVLLNAVLRGPETGIGRNARVGASGQAVVINSQLGENVEIGAGLYRDATLLDGVKTRGFAELRTGTLLEEHAEIGHNVGLKNTILTSAVVAGSCINFCDVFMSGGTSRTDHSEIGSGAVHFNFDPRRDKFGSVIGDVRGVLLRSPRIFIGGNAGLVAPLHIEFGSVVPAGMTIRRDVAGYARPERLRQVRDFDPETYHDVRRKFITTAKLAGTLQALLAWYRLVRAPPAGVFERFLCEMAERRIAAHIRHRAGEIGRVIAKLDRSLSRGKAQDRYRQQHRRVVDSRDSIMATVLRESPEVPPPRRFLQEYQALRGDRRHVEAVAGVSGQSAAAAAGWLLKMAALPVAEMTRIFD